MGVRPLSDASAPGAVILAAGLGRRLGGRPKAALHIGDQSLLERLAAALRGAGVAQPQVVLGPYLDTLLSLAERAGLTPLRHTRAEPSLIDSQRLAISAHLAAQPNRPLWLLLGDLTALTSDDLLTLRAAWEAREAGIEALVPTVAGQRGHPVLLSPSALHAIDAQPAEQGVRHWLAAQSAQVRFQEIDSAGPVQDLDTGEALAALREAWRPLDVGWR